jgi:hypothetical protein
MATLTISELDYRPSYRAALAVSAVTLVLYLLTLAPSTAMWDTSEYIAAAYTLGIPHPPGNPLFVIIGRVFSILPIASSVAVRINILAAICSAVSAGMWFLITERVLVSWFVERWPRILGGVIAALIGATAFTVWNQSHYGFYGYPTNNFLFDGFVVLGDSTQLNNPNIGTLGMFFGDYLTQNMTIANSSIQGQQTGILAPAKVGDVRTTGQTAPA